MTAAPTDQKTVMLFGATGTIGRATAQAMCDAGHRVLCVVRPESASDGLPRQAEKRAIALDHVTADDMDGVDAIVSCLASRSGAPRDAWAIDHDAHVAILRAAKAAAVPQFVLLSAICVQKPRLAFQQAKLAFEDKLMASGLTYSIVRPTAFFKSLSGQVARVRDGKPFLVFGDGTLTACKPISDPDLGEYLAMCLTDTAKKNKLLPIGGPGPAITPMDQADMLFEALGRAPNVRHVPLALMSGIIKVLQLGGLVSPTLRAKADLTRIGQYYATESMLVWDGATYSAEATPSFGSDTLDVHYRALLAGEITADLGDHAVF